MYIMVLLENQNSRWLQLLRQRVPLQTTNSTCSSYDRLFAGLSWRIMCVYVDDVTVFSKTFKGYLYNLNKILSFIKNIELILKIKKIYINYQLIKLLGYKIDYLNLSNMKQWVITIKALKLPKDLKFLENFIGFTIQNWYLIPFYIKRMVLL